MVSSARRRERAFPRRRHPWDSIALRLPHYRTPAGPELAPARASGRRCTMIRFGPAGFLYKDWEGVVYPSPRPRGFDPLAYLANYFDTVEINSTFYGPARPSTAQSWARR